MSDREIGDCPIARVFELREAMGQAGTVQGFMLDQRTPGDGGTTQAKPAPPGGFKDILDVQSFLHHEQGFGRMIHGH